MTAVEGVRREVEDKVAHLVGVVAHGDVVIMRQRDDALVGVDVVDEMGKRLGLLKWM